MSNVSHALMEKKLPTRGTTRGGDEPPMDDDLKERVEKLENGFLEIKTTLDRIEKNTIRTDERLNSIETHFATKAELLEVKTDLTRNISDLRTEFKQGISNLEISIYKIRWSTIAWVFSGNIALLGLVFAVASYFKP